MDFAANAITEVAAMTNSREFIQNYDFRGNLLTYNWMRKTWTKQEREDWFRMYRMGGEPYPNRS
jgi:hypothetical protein